MGTAARAAIAALLASALLHPPATAGAAEGKKAGGTAARAKRESSSANAAGFGLMKERKYADAIARFEKAVEADPRNKAAWNSLGVCHLRLYETGASGTTSLDSALAAFGKSAEIDPAYHPENLRNARAIADQERAWVEAAARRGGAPAGTVESGGDYRSYKLAGEAAEQEGDFELALANYARAEAVASSPKGRSAAANWQGLLCLRRRDPKAAVDHLTRATATDATNKYAWNNLGAALIRLYDSGAGGKELVEQAVAAFRQVAGIDPAYKPENLAEAEELLKDLGGPTPPPAEASPSATTMSEPEPAAE